MKQRQMITKKMKARQISQNLMKQPKKQTQMKPRLIPMKRLMLKKQNLMKQRLTSRLKMRLKSVMKMKRRLHCKTMLKVGLECDSPKLVNHIFILLPALKEPLSPRIHCGHATIF